jgi:hypothetical protein
MLMLAMVGSCQREQPVSERPSFQKGLYVDPVSGALSRPVDPNAVDSLTDAYGRLFDHTADRLEQLTSMVARQSGSCDQAAERVRAFLIVHGLNDARRFESFAERLWMRNRKEANLVVQRATPRIERRMARFKTRLSQRQKDLDAFTRRCPDAADQVQEALERFLEQTVGRP